MKMKFKLLATAFAAAGVLGATAASAQGIAFNGYLRTGLGGTTEGGNQQCFGGPFPIRSKFRLGNECDTYGEAQLTAPFGKQDGAWGKYVLMLALQNGDESDYSNVEDGTFTIANRQNYFQFGGVFPKGALEDAKLWIGKRYYNRHDIHINDYFYWNNSGQGAGLEDIDLGGVKAAVAFHQNGGNSTGLNGLGAKRLSGRLYGLGVNPGGTLEGEVVYLWGSRAGDPPAGTTPTKEGKGWQLFVEHTQNGLLGGFNKLALVLGGDLGAGYEWLPTYAGGNDAKGSAWRIHDQLYFDFKGTGWSGMFTTSYGVYDDDNPNGTKNKWFNIGVRPQYNFTDNYSIAFEAGYDQGKGTAVNAPTAKLAKLTVAPQVSLAGGFWARPVMRAFVTYAKWNDAARPQANNVFGTKNNGVSYGLQVEAWW